MPTDKWCVRRVLAMALACVLLMGIFPAGAALAEEDGMVRVKLTRLGSNSEITFQTTCDYYVQGNASLRVPAGGSATVSASESGLYLTVNGTRISMGGSLALMRSEAGKEGVRFTSPSMSNLYCGDLIFSASSSILTVILNIYVEDYLYGVVGNEMSPSWPLEALKAQAVAARNIALSRKASRANKAYHLVDNSNDQVYRGLNTSSTYANVLKAVDETRGVVLYCDGKLIGCYYSASNGGQIESSRNVWGGSIKYSAVKDDPYDYASSGAVRSAAIRKDASNLNASLEQALVDGVTAQMQAMGVEIAGDGVMIERIESITPGNARFDAPSRVYQTLSFGIEASVKRADGQIASGVMTVDVPTFGGVEEWYGLSINSANNETVWVETEESAFRISFRRQGHGVGMSQRGAQVMARDHGMSCADILAFYYPNTAARRLALSDATSDQQAEPQYTIIANARAAEGAAIYSGASTGSDVIVNLEKGAAVEVYAVSGSWAAVGSGESRGFMQTEKLTGYVPAGETVTNANSTLAQVSDENGASLRELPADGATQRKLLSEGSLVRVAAYTQSWASVLTAEGEAGYVRVSALEPYSVQPTPTPTPAVTVPEGELYAQVVPANGTALRGQADESTLPAAVLACGSYVRVQAYSDVWAHVLTPVGATGYVLRADLRIVDKAEIAVTPTPAPTSGVVIPEEAMYAKAMKPAAVYKSASTSSSLLVTLSKGAYVRVLAYTQSWVHVETAAGVKGYVQISRLCIVPAEEALATPTPEPTMSTPGVMIADGNMYARALKDTQVYSAARTSASAVASLKKGDCALVLAYTTSWALLETDSGAQGFVPISRLRAITKEEALATPAPTAAPEDNPGHVTVLDGARNMYISSASAKMYKSFSASSGPLYTLAYGTQVQMGAYNAEWAYVRYNGKLGFIRLDSLTANPPVAKSASDVIVAEFSAQATRRAYVYSGPAERGDPIGLLSKGQRVTVLAYNNAYALIDVSGNRGFVALGNLKIVA